MKSKLLGTVAALLAAVLLLPCGAQALSCQKGILIDGQTGRVLFEKNADSRSLIASTTKIMTALVICEQCNVLDRVRIPKEAVGIEGSSMYLKEGEVLTVQELLYGLMLHSGNDAAVALAIYCAGTVELFAQLMNDKARRLGLNNSHFENPNGLDSPGHYSTARDLAVLTAYAMNNPIFAKTVSTKTVRVGQRSLQNHNKLLWRLEGAEGVKTGYTRAAGRILVSSALRSGRRLICVTINDGNDWADHQALINDGFSRFSMEKLIARGQSLGMRQVIGGESEQVQLLAAEDLQLPIAREEQVQIVLSAPEFVYAPVLQGQKAGFAYALIDGQPAGKAELVYAQSIEQQKPQKKGFFRGLFGG